MTRSRPSRNARWAIGLSLVALFSVVALGAMAVAFGQLVSGWDTEGSGEPSEWADATAIATILDVDLYNLADEKQNQYFDREGGYAGYAQVDITFVTDGLSLDGPTTSVAWMSWPDELDLPAPGDQVKIEYNAQDPEAWPALAGTAAGEPEIGLTSDAPVAAPLTGDIAAASTAESADDSAAESAGGEVTAPVRWTIWVSSLLALVTLIATVIWARRAEPAERAQNPARQPYPAQWQYPAQQSPAQPYPAQQHYPVQQPYPVQQYPAQQSYPAQQPYPVQQQYPVQQYPEPQSPTRPPPPESPFDRLTPPA
jgi:hypothetical protein